MFEDLPEPLPGNLQELHKLHKRLNRMTVSYKPDHGRSRSLPNAVLTPRPKKMLSLRQNDLLAIERDGGAPEILRVVKFSTIGTLALAAANEAGALKARDTAPADTDPFKYVYATGGSLKKMKARRVRIDPLGRVFDPGPRE